MGAGAIAAESRIAPGISCAAVTAATFVTDQATKLLAATRLDGLEVPLVGDAFLTLAYNDTFARGMALGGATLPATLLLASTVLLLVGRACAPLAGIDRAAPVGLGLVAGATIGNAADFVHTGRGAVDFLGVQTAEGALIFNLADLAAYAGVAILARSVWRIALSIRAERGEARALASDRARTGRPKAVETEVVRPVPLFTEPGVARRTDDAPTAPATTPVEPVHEDEPVVERKR